MADQLDNITLENDNKIELKKEFELNIDEQKYKIIIELYQDEITFELILESELSCYNYIKRYNYESAIKELNLLKNDYNNLKQIYNYINIKEYKIINKQENKMLILDNKHKILLEAKTNEKIKDLLIKYNGNDEFYKKYDNILKEKVNGKILYFDEYENKEKIKYEGGIINGFYDGRGILYDNSGEIIYNGFFKKGKYHGYGKEYSNKKLKYEGFFVDGEYEGKGTLYDENGKRFEGNFIDGKLNEIIIIYLNGKKIKKVLYQYGSKLPNIDVILYDNDKEVYFGLLVNGKPKEGKNLPEYNYNDKFKIYQGDFLNYNYHGTGTLYFENCQLIFFSGKFEMNKFIEGKLYDLKGNITYNGKYINNLPIEGKNISIYELNRELKYQGDILDCKYHGTGKYYIDKILIYEGEFKEGLFNGIGKKYKNGILYYQGNFIKDKIKGKGIKYYKNGQKHIEGDFDFENYYSKGKLYDLDGKYICSTEFKNFIPKEGTNIKLYDEDKYLKYEGNMKNYKYNGKGKLYGKVEKYLSNSDIEYILIYEGEFCDNLFQGYGKLYKEHYPYGYFEGNFQNGVFIGCKGIKYYKNGAIKLKGIFENGSFEGDYYDPKGKKIYTGKIIDDIYFDSDFIILYNDDGCKLFEGYIKNNDTNYIEKIVLYSQNYLNEKYSSNLEKKDFKGNIGFISKNYAGKTSLIKRIIYEKFIDEFPIVRFGLEYYKYTYIYNNAQYQVVIHSMHGNCSFDRIKLDGLKSCIITLYVIDITKNEDIDELFIFKIYESMKPEKKFIYLVMTKIDEILDNNKYEKYREIVLKLLMKGYIHRYFEVSSKTNEGIDSLRNCLKYDCCLILNSYSLLNNGIEDFKIMDLEGSLKKSNKKVCV